MKDCDIREANRQSQLEFERVRDFIIAHYCLSRRSDDEFWRYVPHMAIPETLQRKLDVYKSRGVFLSYE